MCTNSFYQVLSAEAYSKHGFNIHGVVFDELHTQPNRKLFDVMTKGSGDARMQPLYFLITTAGNDTNTICYEVHQKAQDILDGRKVDPTFYPVIYGAEPDEDWTDPEVWKKANPSLGITVGIDKVEAACESAKQNPGEENSFRQLRLNQWVKQAVRWMPMDKWDACAFPVNEDDLEGRVCYGGLDLSSTTDITSFVLVFPPRDEDDKYVILPYFWVPEDPAIRDVLEEGTDANGGYLVPIEFEHTLVQALNENNIMRTIGCKVITTQNERKIPVANGHTQAAWTAENGAYTESNPTFAQTSIDAFKLTDLIKVSDELLSDSFFDIEGYISEEFGRAFGEAEEDAFINGAVQTGQTAIDRPTGLFIPSTAGGAPSGVTAASATAITADELISLVYSLKAPYRSKAKFLMNDATVAAIRKLKDLNGVYVWQPALTAGEPDRLLGYPLYTSPKVPTMAAGARAIAFGDFSCYWIADRAGRTIKRLNELYATNGQVGFTCTERVDGKLILSEGIKILDMKATSGS